MRHLTPYEERLVELVHLLSYGTPEEYGFTLHEVKRFLTKNLPKKKINVLQSLEEDTSVLEEVRNFLRHS